MISAFNSLTLSPALAALLLRPRSRACSRRCPGRRSWPLGGWAGYAFGGPQLLKLAHAAGPQVDAFVLRLGGNLNLSWLTLELAASLVGMLAGAFAGYLVSGVLNRIFGWTFFLFNRAFDAATAIYTRMVAGLLRISILVLFALRWPARPDVLGLHAHADRIHPLAGQGLSAGQRAASRLVVAGAHAAGDEERRAAREQA